MKRCSRAEATILSSEAEVARMAKWLKEKFPNSGRLIFYSGAYGYVAASVTGASMIYPIRDANLPPYA